MITMWTSKIFPDDKLDGGLVASMLQPSVKESLTVPTPTDKPLWELMYDAGRDEPGTPFDSIAAEIEAVRKYLFTSNDLSVDTTQEVWEYHWDLMARLDEQARIAREGK